MMFNEMTPEEAMKILEPLYKRREGLYGDHIGPFNQLRDDHQKKILEIANLNISEVPLFGIVDEEDIVLYLSNKRIGWTTNGGLETRELKDLDDVQTRPSSGDVQKSLRSMNLKFNAEEPILLDCRNPEWQKGIFQVLDYIASQNKHE